MKNLKKLLPAFALVVGLGLVFTQSAFKAEKFATPTHYNSNPSAITAPVWVPLGSKIIGTEEGEYSCNDNPTRPCLASLSMGVFTTEDFGNFEQN